MLKCLFFCAAAIVALGCSDDKKILFPVTDIVLKSPQLVEERLGKPDSAYTIRIMGKPIYCQRYDQFNVEVQFMGGQASDIVMYGPHGLPFDQTALKALGIAEKIHPADYKKGRYIRWTDTKEFSAISFYNPEFDSLGRIINFSVFLKAKSSHELVN
jgi:hypothetical protein